MQILSIPADNVASLTFDAIIIATSNVCKLHFLFLVSKTGERNSSSLGIGNEIIEQLEHAHCQIDVLAFVKFC